MFQQFRALPYRDPYETRIPLCLHRSSQYLNVSLRFVCERLFAERRVVVTIRQRRRRGVVGE